MAQAQLVSPPKLLMNSMHEGQLVAGLSNFNHDSVQRLVFVTRIEPWVPQITDSLYTMHEEVVFWHQPSARTDIHLEMPYVSTKEVLLSTRIHQTVRNSDDSVDFHGSTATCKHESGYIWL